MSHDAHALPEKPNTSSSAAFFAVIIFVGFIVALLNFTQAMSHDDSGHGGHGTEHAAPAHGTPAHGTEASHAAPSAHGTEAPATHGTETPAAHGTEAAHGDEAHGEKDAAHTDKGAAEHH